MDSSSQQPIAQTDFQNANAILDSISAPKDSQPTKLRVKNFKNRVFNLLKIYTSQSPNVNPLIECLKQEMFFSEPEKMQELLKLVMNKQNVSLENLSQLAEYFKVILLYKDGKQAGDAVALQFVRLLRKIAGIDQELAHSFIVNMLKAFAYERKCRLNINFFFYFFRKYEHPQDIKKVFIEKLQEFLQDEKLRNAQKKQLTKILQRLDKSARIKNGHVKKEENLQNQIQAEDDEDDIKTTNKKNTSFEKVKKHQENDKIQEQSKQISGKNVSKEQMQKLERIKANKKKNRKGNQSQKPNQNQKKNQHQKPHPHQQQHKNLKPNKNQKINKHQKQEKNPKQDRNQKPHQNPKHSQTPQKKIKDKKPFKNNKQPQQNNQIHQKKNHQNSKPKSNKNQQNPDVKPQKNNKNNNTRPRSQ